MPQPCGLLQSAFSMQGGDLSPSSMHMLKPCGLLQSAFSVQGGYLSPVSMHMLKRCGLWQSVLSMQGGDVSPNSMHMLHTQRSLPESVEIIRGICMGGFDTAKAAVAQGRAAAQDFK